MSDVSTPLPSLADRVRHVDAGGTVVAVHFLKSTPVFVLGEEDLLFAGENGEKRVTVHAGAILASASDGKRIVTGGDDGKVVATDETGEHTVVATDEKKRWIDHVALGARRRRRLVGRQDRLRAAGERRGADVRCSFHSRGARLRAERFSACDRALQRRHALVSRMPPAPSRRRWSGRARI